MIHSSGNTFQPLAKTKEDLRTLLQRQALWYTLTEFAEKQNILMTVNLLRHEFSNYRVINPDRGDVAFIIRKTAKVLDYGGRLSIKGVPGPAARGGHGPRYNSYMNIKYMGEVISANGLHTVVARIPGRSPRFDEQLKQLDDMGKQMTRFAKGTRISIGSGDLNGSLPGRSDMQRIFDKYDMTTTSEERDDNTPTHDHSRLDYVWTMDRDSRASCKDMKVLKGLNLHTDHEPIEVVIHIR